LRQEEEQLGRVDAYLSQLADEQAARYDVVVRQMEPSLVASVRCWIAAQNEGEADNIEAIFEELEQHASRFKARASLPPAIIYHDSEYRANGQDLEIVVPLTNMIPEKEGMRVYTLPGWETVACLIHSGGYERLSQTFGTLLQWIESNNYVIAGPMREVFLRFGANQEDYALPETYVTTQVDELVTELQLPVSKFGNA
jgi:effector-binding domain-containing protein